MSGATAIRSSTYAHFGFCVFASTDGAMGQCRETTRCVQTVTGSGLGAGGWDRCPVLVSSIGLTRVRLLHVEGRVLLVEGLDALNGRPILDLKSVDRWISFAVVTCARLSPSVPAVTPNRLPSFASHEHGGSQPFVGSGRDRSQSPCSHCHPRPCPSLRVPSV